MDSHDESAERGLHDNRKDHLVDYTGGVREAGLHHALEHPGFPMHALEVLDEGFFDLPLRFGSQAVDECQQHIHPTDGSVDTLSPHHVE
jgi:hypothetical protein